MESTNNYRPAISYHCCWNCRYSSKSNNKIECPKLNVVVRENNVCNLFSNDLYHNT